MAQYRYIITCRECGEIQSDTSNDGLFDKKFLTVAALVLVFAAVMLLV